MGVDSKIHHLEKGLRISIRGRIDERAHMPDLKDQEFTELIIDCQEVKMINSVGVKKWAEWSKTIDHVPVHVENFPTVLVNQCNMVFDFMPKSTHYRSFYVPYYSDSTGESEDVLFVEGKDFKYSDDKNEVSVFHRDHNSSKSGAPMEMDIIPSKFFRFLKGKLSYT